MRSPTVLHPELPEWALSGLGGPRDTLRYSALLRLAVSLSVRTEINIIFFKLRSLKELSTAGKTIIFHNLSTADLKYPFKSKAGGFRP